MEREFCHYLQSLPPPDRQDVLLTLVHLLDDGDLAQVSQLALNEEKKRHKRREAVRQSAAKRVIPVTCSPQRQSGREPFKKLRIGPSATSTPIVTSVRKPIQPVKKSRDLLSALVDGQPESPKKETPVCAPDTEKQHNGDLSPEEEEFMMNSEDDAIVSMVQYEPDAGETTDREIDTTTESTMSLAADRPDDAIGFFVRANGRKMCIKNEQKAHSIFESILQ